MSRGQPRPAGFRGAKASARGPVVAGERRAKQWTAVILCYALAACGGGATGGREGARGTASPPAESGTAAGPAEARPAREQAAEAVPADARERFWQVFRRAVRARREGRTAVALAAYEEALALSPRHGDSLYYAAQLRAERFDLGRALAYLERLATVEPRSARPWQQLAAANAEPVPGWVPDLARSRVAVDRALELHPDVSLNYLLRARQLAYAGDARAAAAPLQTALRHNPKLAGGYLLRLWLAPASRRRVEARLVREAVVRELCGGEEGRGAACPRHAALHVALGAALSGDPEAAAAGFVPAADPSAPGSVRAEEPATGPRAERRVGIDLDGDGRGDLDLLAAAAGAWLAREGAPLPEPRAAAAWEAADHGPWPVPARGAFVRGPAGVRAVVAGGGRHPLRVFGGEGSVLRQVRLSLPAISGAVVAVADFDGDGGDDLFVANAAEASRDGGWLLYARDRYAEPTPLGGGPFTAAAAGDLDDDGDPDLLVARRPPAGADAAYLRAGAEGAARLQLLLGWRNEAGRLVAWEVPLPEVVGFVSDLLVADVDGDGHTDVYVATAPPGPEEVQPDRWFRGIGEGRYEDATPRLGPARFGATVRALLEGPGRLVLRRGGRLPGEPGVWVRLSLR